MKINTDFWTSQHHYNTFLCPEELTKKHYFKLSSSQKEIVTLARKQLMDLYDLLHDKLKLMLDEKNNNYYNPDMVFFVEFVISRINYKHIIPYCCELLKICDIFFEVLPDKNSIELSVKKVIIDPKFFYNILQKRNVNIDFDYEDFLEYRDFCYNNLNIKHNPKEGIAFESLYYPEQNQEIVDHDVEDHLDYEDGEGKYSPYVDYESYDSWSEEHYNSERKIPSVLEYRNDKYVEKNYYTRKEIEELKKEDIPAPFPWERITLFYDAYFIFFSRIILNTKIKNIKLSNK